MISKAVKIIILINMQISLINATKSILNATSCDSKTTGLNLAIFYVLILFIIVTVIGNAFICTVIAMTPSFRKNNTYLLFFSLAVADMLVGAIVIPINTKRIYNNRLFCMSEIACWISMILERTLSIASLTHLLVIGLERFLSLKFTFQYQKYATRNTTLISILCIWIYSFFWSFLGIFDWHSFQSTAIFSIHYYELKCNNGPSNNKAYFISSYVLCFFFPIAVMIYTYSYVYRTAVRHLKAIERHEIGGKRDKELKRKERQHKMVQSIVIVFIVYLLCWLPIIITYFVRIFSKVTIGLYTYILVTEILPPFNSTTNPFIYVISNKQFRQRVCELLSGKKKERLEDSLSKQRSFNDVSKIVSKFLKTNDSSNSNLLNMSPQKIGK